MPVNRSIAYAIEYIYCTCNTYGLSIHILCCGGQFAPFFGRFSAVFLHFSVLLVAILQLFCFCTLFSKFCYIILHLFWVCLSIFSSHFLPFLAILTLKKKENFLKKRNKLCQVLNPCLLGDSPLSLPQSHRGIR